MCKKLSAKYYQENRERLQKNLVKGIKIFPKNKKERRKYGREHCKISQKMQKIHWLNIKKVLENEKKHFIIIIRKYYHFRNFAS